MISSKKKSCLQKPNRRAALLVHIGRRCARMVDETVAWHRTRLAELLAEGQANGELPPDFEPRHLAAAIAVVIQGAHVLAKAAQSRQPFDDAIAGAIALLSTQRADKANP